MEVRNLLTEGILGGYEGRLEWGDGGLDGV